MNFFYHITKKDDGEFYIECHMDEFRYNFEIGHLKINANKIFIADQDVSKYLNFLFLFLVNFIKYKNQISKPFFYCLLLLLF